MPELLLVIFSKGRNALKYSCRGEEKYIYWLYILI